MAYIGDNLLCEVQLWKGVQIVSLYEYVETHLIQVRRDLSLSQDERWRLAVRSLHQLRLPYGLLALPGLFYQSKRGFWRPLGGIWNMRGIICSSLYSEAYQYTTGKTIVDNQLNIATPADLSRSPRLSNVDIDWLRIVETPL